MVAQGVAAARQKLIAATGILALLVASCAPAEDGTVLRLAHTMNQDHPVHIAMAEMADRLAEMSGGEMSLIVYANGQLGTERELIELLQIGSISMTKVSTLSAEGFAPNMAIFSVPYLFDDDDHLWRVLEGEIGQELLDGLSPALLKGMGYYDAGSRSFYTKDAPVLGPADLAGKKVRVLPSRATIEMIAALGGSATPVSFGELYTALQQGVVDAAENNPPSYYLSKHYEAAPFYTLDEHTAVPDLVLMSLKVWEGLTEQEQSWVSQAFAESVTRQRQLWAEAEREAIEQVQAAGVVVTYPDKTPFREAVAPLKDAQQGTPIGALITRIEAIADPSDGPRPDPRAEDTAQ